VRSSLGSLVCPTLIDSLHLLVGGKGRGEAKGNRGGGTSDVPSLGSALGGLWSSDKDTHP